MERKRTSKEPRNTADLPVESRAAAGIKGGLMVASIIGLANRTKTVDAATKTLEDQGSMQTFEIQN